MNRTPPHAPGDETVTLDISVTSFRPGERRGTILRLGADSFKLSQEQSERLAGDLLDAVRPDLRVEPHGQDPSGLCERAGSGALAPGGALTPGEDLTDTTLTDNPTGTDTGRPIGLEPSAVSAQRPEAEGGPAMGREETAQAAQTACRQRTSDHRCGVQPTTREGIGQLATRPGSLAIRGDIPGGCGPCGPAIYTNREPA